MFINRWKDKEDVVHIYAREYYSAINKEILPSATIRMELEGIMLSENSLTEKDKYYMVLLICGIWKLHKLASIYIKKDSDTENKLVITMRKSEVGRGMIKVGD